MCVGRCIMLDFKSLQDWNVRMNNGRKKKVAKALAGYIISDRVAVHFANCYWLCEQQSEGLDANMQKLKATQQRQPVRSKPSFW
jgi:hypothetical protein